MNIQFPSRNFAAAAFALLLLSGAATAQNGVDTQTTTIRNETKVNPRVSDAQRNFDWGKGKTKVRDQLPNPYRLNGRRDALLESITGVLREQKILLDEASSRPRDGILVTQPFVFAKGSVVTPGELSRYGVVEVSDSSWTRAQYTLTIEVQSLDGVQNAVAVNAKVEGRAGNGLMSEWVTVRSSGLAEDEFLSKLVEMVTGNSPEPEQDVPEQ
jgi:hypothetical protein